MASFEVNNDGKNKYQFTVKGDDLEETITTTFDLNVEQENGLLEDEHIEQIEKELTELMDDFLEQAHFKVYQEYKRQINEGTD